MSDTAIGYVKPRTDEEYIAAIDAMLAELERSEERSRERRQRIKRTMAEMEASGRRSDAIMARTQKILEALPEWMKPNVG